MTKLLISQLKQGMVVNTGRGNRTIQKLIRVNKSPQGVLVYIWQASKSGPSQSSVIAAKGTLECEVINYEQFYHHQ
ncbi:hypothetical protein vBAspATola_29 [Aeromonas phage vB_AspA_Tola]|nr:hypothetical protein vBAspATola_29 [Aeromonas phage vB_AspA_Tola]